MTTLPRRLAGLLLVTTLAVLGLAACQPAFDAGGRTSSITKVSTSTVDGWRYDFYRNTAYPCAVSGYQTFTIATRVGSSPTASRPLWVRMHGGGVGYFTSAGVVVPNTKQKVEEGPATQRSQLNGALVDDVRADAAGFRLLTVSMCDHDIYGGADIPDPNNPGTIPGGGPRTVNGLYATKAAVQFTLGAYPTSDYFLHGGSAGSYGSYHVAWSLQEQGIPPPAWWPTPGCSTRSGWRPWATTPSAGAPPRPAPRSPSACTPTSPTRPTSRTC
ncbi:hypothetical protein KSP35_20645 [Aquihabitans sp. G128]|uniref:hypothetical protein n=1 Tax=Aquihabitans sp. G128 TaxID=2849779 RepID=UPI001C235B71|nr:hypothetical protein [Aquihabitans sp. G128]QXC60702.1 hypothetical protein KSP35_20645 [Aquihabitans sp. G128]